MISKIKIEAKARDVLLTMTQSPMLEFEPTVILWTSPRTLAPYHTLLPVPIVTSPMTDAVGATNAQLAMEGVLPCARFTIIKREEERDKLLSTTKYVLQMITTSLIVNICVVSSFRLLKTMTKTPTAYSMSLVDGLTVSTILTTYNQSDIEIFEILEK